MMHDPPHPGEILRADYLAPLGLTVTDAASALGVTRKTLSAVLNERAGVIDVVLVGQAETRTVRAYRSGGRRFAAAEGRLDRLEADGEAWQVTEEALIGPDGTRLARLPGHVAYWFAWSGFQGG